MKVRISLGRKGSKDRRNWLPERPQDHRPGLPEDPQQDLRPWLPEHPTERRKWLLPNESGVRKEK
ncbi:MAG: hypothetical protein SFU56_22200 [Capsulimonadales bacterium]|nr:hypothetical protein [Capsulimonadales bacterium]